MQVWSASCNAMSECSFRMQMHYSFNARLSMQNTMQGAIYFSQFWMLASVFCVAYAWLNASAMQCLVAMYGCNATMQCRARLVDTISECKLRMRLPIPCSFLMDFALWFLSFEMQMHKALCLDCAWMWVVLLLFKAWTFMRYLVLSPSSWLHEQWGWDIVEQCDTQVLVLVANAYFFQCH